MRDPHQDDTTFIYNTHAREYQSNTQNFVFPENMFEDFLEYVPGKKILDIGCGYGRDMLRMKERWFSPQWVEISQELIKLADGKIKQDIIQMDMTEIWEQFRSESFDGIFAAASLLHLEKEIGVQVLCDIFSLLKKWGVLFFEAKIHPENKTTTEIKESISLPWKFKKYTLYGEDECDEVLHTLWFSFLKTHSNEHLGTIWKIYICRK